MDQLRAQLKALCDKLERQKGEAPAIARVIRALLAAHPAPHSK
jgi:hypothetical protein